MDDYMYHDYDSEPSEKTGTRAKVRSIIGTVLILCWFAAIAVWLILRDTDNIRTDFKETAFSKHSFSETVIEGDNEFLSLEKALAGGRSLLADKEFKSKYPLFYSMITADGLNSSEKKLVADDKNGYMTLCEPYISSQKQSQSGFCGIIDIDVLLLPYTVADGSLGIGQPQRLSFSCDLTDAIGVASVSIKESRADSFRLNFYDLSIETDCGGDVLYTLDLCEYPTKSECDDKTLFSKITADGETGTLTGGNDPTSKQISGKITLGDGGRLKLGFDKLMYRKYGGFTVSMDKNASFEIILNEGRK